MLNSTRNCAQMKTNSANAGRDSMSCCSAGHAVEVCEDRLMGTSQDVTPHFVCSGALLCAYYWSWETSALQLGIEAKNDAHIRLQG